MESKGVGTICILCLKNEACEIESHAIPRMFVRDIIKRSPKGKRHFYPIDLGRTYKIGSNNKVQDFGKEMSVLCNECENGLLNKIETKFSAEVRNQIDASPVVYFENPVLHAKEFDRYTSANLTRFIASILWRLHSFENADIAGIRLTSQEIIDYRQLTLNEHFHTTPYIIPIHSGTKLHSASSSTITFTYDLGIHYLQLSDWVFLVFSRNRKEAIESLTQLGFTDCLNARLIVYCFNNDMDWYHFCHTSQVKALEKSSNKITNSNIEWKIDNYVKKTMESVLDILKMSHPYGRMNSIF
jgi:hypothetical protein